MPCKECGGLLNAWDNCFTAGCPNTIVPQSHPGYPKGKGPRTPIKKQSARKKKEIRETKDIRKVLPGERCEICNGNNKICTHEIPAGSHRHKAVYDRRCQLRLCVDCHRELQSMSYVGQLWALVRAKIAGINEAVGSIAVSVEDVRKIL